MLRYDDGTNVGWCSSTRQPSAMKSVDHQSRQVGDFARPELGRCCGVLAIENRSRVGLPMLSPLRIESGFVGAGISIIVVANEGSIAIDDCALAVPLLVSTTFTPSCTCTASDAGEDTTDVPAGNVCEVPCAGGSIGLIANPLLRARSVIRNAAISDPPKSSPLIANPLLRTKSVVRNAAIVAPPRSSPKCPSTIFTSFSCTCTGSGACEDTMDVPEVSLC